MPDQQQDPVAQAAAAEAAAPRPMAAIIELPQEPKTAVALPVAFDFRPTSLTEVMALADMMAKSTIIPKDYQGNPGNVVIAIQLGSELGLKPLQAMQNIAVINGRPTVWGDAVLAIVRASVDSAGNKMLEGISETYDEATNTATCSVKRRGAAKPCVRTFSHADAFKAGLLNKEIWKAYERRMLQMRARSWALRDEFTDVLRGMSIAEEVIDYVPEKDITPAAEHPLGPSSPAEKSKADRLKEKIKGVPAESGPTVLDVVAQFDKLAKGDMDGLQQTVDLARGLTRPEDQTLANTAYKRAKARVTGHSTETLEDGGQAASSAA